MKTRKVDVAVIGAGSAGMRAYRAASAHTDSVVLIEGGAYGTTCARVGCMPSKLLIAAAEAAHAVTEAPRFGVNPGEVAIDGAAVMDRVRSERDRFVGFVVDAVEALPEASRIRGHARFVDDHRIHVSAPESEDDVIVEADRVVIATGSRPVYPAHFAALGSRLVVNDDVFSWRTLPGSVAVFGPGVIGLELGQALARLGVETHVFGRGGQVGPLTDPQVVASYRDALAGELHLDADASVTALDPVEDGVRIDFTGPRGETRTITVDYVLAATGRRPNVDALDLENTTLPLDERGIPIFDPFTLQIGDSGVFIAGDVNDDRPLLHEAADEGAVAGDNAGRFPEVEPGRRRTPLAIVFTDPQLAMVGETWRQVADRPVVVGSVSFDDQGRSRVMGQNRGLLRIYAEPGTGRFLGAEMAGPRAEHLGHLLAWAHQAGMTVEQMLEMPFYHPVIEEGLRTALRDAREQLEAGPRLPRAA